METIEKKSKQITKSDLLKQITLSLNDDTCFMYQEKMEISSAKHNIKRSEDDVARAWVSNIIAPSDLYILYAVYQLSFATVSMISDMLKIYKRTMPDKNLPSTEENAVRNRVVEMCQSGVLAGKKITMPTDGRKIIVYACVHNGFRLLQMQMQGYIYADDMLLALNDMLLFERTACSYCAVALASLKGISCTEIQGFGEDRAFGKEYKPKLNAKICLNRNDQEYVIAFEPLYYSFNQKFDSMQDIVTRHKSRLKIIMRWISSCKTILHKNPKVVIVCENMEGLDRAAIFIHHELPELEEYVDFTSETVLRCLKGSGLERAGFLKILYDDEGNMKFGVDVLFS